MKIVGIMPVRNEDWVLGLSARVALMWCDALVILDHASTDSTAQIIDEIADEYPGRICSVIRNDPSWDEMAHRQEMLALARVGQYTHIAIIDADEVLTGNLVSDPDIPPIRNIIKTLPAGHILQLPGYNLRGGSDRYHANGLWGRRWFSTVFRDDPALHWSGDRFHHREPMGLPLKPYRPIPQDNSGVMHLWGMEERRLKAKHAWYKITERLRFPARSIADIDKQYSQAIHGTGSSDCPATWTYNPVPLSWLTPYDMLGNYLITGKEPWQEQACHEAVAKHGREMFVGLDLFGVI